MQKENKNKFIVGTGLNIEKEFAEQSHEDYVFGGFFDDKAKVLGGYMIGIGDYMSKEEVERYLPKGERQNIGEDKQDCVSRSFHNILETVLNYAILNNEIKSENIEWLEKNGYIQNGEVELSDRFIAIKSGTDPYNGGNSLKSAPETARKVGVIPKHLLPQVESLKDYYDPQSITPEMENLGQEFLKRFTINYQKVYPVNYKDTVIHTGGYAWGDLLDGVYQRVEYAFTHAFMGFPVNKAFDNYIDSFDGDFIKKLADDYKLFPYSYRIILNEREKVKTNCLLDLFRRLL